MASQPRLQVVGASKNKISALKRFSYLPSLSVQGKASPQGCIVCSLTLHFCQRMFPRLEPVTSLSHGSNFNSYSRLPFKNLLKGAAAGIRSWDGRHKSYA